MLKPLPWATSTEQQMAYLTAQQVKAAKRKSIWQCVNESDPEKLQEWTNPAHPAQQINQRSKQGLTPLELAIRIVALPYNTEASYGVSNTFKCISLLAATSNNETIKSALDYFDRVKTQRVKYNNYGIRRAANIKNLEQAHAIVLARGAVIRV